MKEMKRILLAGSPAEIEEEARAACRLLAADKQLTGMRLCELAIVLAANPDLQVSIVTYSESSQELEAVLQGAPQCDTVTVSRHSSGAWCAIEWNQWAPIGTDANITSTAGLITAVLGLGVPQARDGDAVLAVNRAPDEMHTAELIAAYRHARALARFRPPGQLAKALAGWVFTARRVWMHAARTLLTWNAWRETARNERHRSSGIRQ